MATKFKTLRDEEIVRMARAKVTESAAATYTEVALDTQLSIERGVIWLINGIEIGFTQLDILDELAAAGNEKVEAQVVREPKTDILTYENPDLIQGYRRGLARSAAIGTDAGPLWFPIDTPIVFDYSPPLPYAAQQIHCGIKGSDSASGHIVTFRIRYTIRAVSDKYFFRVAQALLG